jgi:FlaA1/EpsC-like NDP-sugar epimerase
VPADYLFIIPVAVVILLPIFALNRLYHYHTLLGGSQEYAAVFRACSYGMIVLVFASFLQRTEPLSRGWLLATWILTNVLVGVSRFAWRRFFHLSTTICRSARR